MLILNNSCRSNVISTQLAQLVMCMCRETEFCKFECLPGGSKADLDCASVFELSSFWQKVIGLNATILKY